jgi:hypothetical protein
MKNVKRFEEYIEEGIVYKITPDLERLKNLIEESKRKNILLKKMISNLGIDNENANDYVEYCYNIIMFLIRAKMLKEGYNSSGYKAHEAEVAYSIKLGLEEYEINFLDQLRFFRNGILYYGKKFDKEYAKKTIEFTKKIYKKLN